MNLTMFALGMTMLGGVGAAELPLTIESLKTEGLYWPGQTIKGTAQKVEKLGYYEVKSDDAKLLLDGKTDWKGSVKTYFWGNHPKKVTIMVDLGEPCAVEKVTLLQGCADQKGNLIEQIDVAGALEKGADDRYDSPQTLTLKELPANPGKTYAMTIPMHDKVYRYLRIVCSSKKSAMMVLGELKVSGKKSAAPRQAVLPPDTWRYELENMPGTFKLTKSDLIGGAGVFVTRTHNVTLEIPGQPKKFYAWLRYADNGAKTVECALAGVPKAMPSTGGKWLWKQAGEVATSPFSLQLRRKDRENGLCDTLLLTASPTFDPNSVTSQMELKKVPELQEKLPFAQELLRKDPKISPDDFARRVVEHHGIKYRKPGRTIDADNNLLLNGKPFFPLGFYHVQPDDKRIAQAKVNTFITNNIINADWGRGHAAVISHLASLRAYDEVVERLRKSDAKRIAMHYLCDEPDGHIGTTLRDIELLNAVVKAVCPDNPTFLNFAANSTMHKAFVVTDAIGLDHYPIPSGRIADIGYTMDAMRYFSHNRPVIFVPQAFSWGGYGQKNGRYPTPDEMRAMTLMGLIHGAKGLLFYEFPAPHMSSKTSLAEINPALWQDLVKFIAQLDGMKDCFLGPLTAFPGKIEAPQSARRPEFGIVTDAACRTVALMAVNPWESSTACRIKWDFPGVKLVPQTVRGVTVNDGNFNFQPFGTAIYEVKNLPAAKLKKMTTAELLSALKPIFERSAAAADLTLRIGQTIDLRDTWRSLNRPDSAKITATATGLHITASLRFPVGARSLCKERDGRVWNDPALELFFGMPNQPAYVHLMVNTLNVQADWKFDATQNNPVNKKINYTWKSHVNSAGEVADFIIDIPWSTLRDMTGAKPGEIMTFNMASSGGLLDWVGLTGSGYHAPVRFGRIKLLP